MSPIVPIMTNILAILTVVGQLMVFTMLFALLFKKNRFSKFVLKLTNKRVLFFCFVVVLFATLGSLFYSEIAGYEPCKLCWYQRILMYPQVLLFVIAMWKEERCILDYSMVMSGFGALISTYHYLLQVGVIKESSCSALGYSVACSDHFSMTFGYITIPIMALTAFVMVFLFTIIGRMMGKSD